MATQNLSQTNLFFVAAGPLPSAILHVEQNTRKILKIYIKMKRASYDFFEISIFRKMASKIVFSIKFDANFRKIEI